MFKQFKPTPKFWAVNFYLASSLFMAWFALLCAIKMFALYPWVGSLICVWSILASGMLFILALQALATEKGIY
jgi:hypothetical protein|tara:strand:+ start:211 stop:429 length:219 start_codon:yes stop_codon:yes gene_type:complete